MWILDTSSLFSMINRRVTAPWVLGFCTMFGWACGESLPANEEQPVPPAFTATSVTPAFYGISGESAGFDDSQARVLRGLGVGMVRLQLNGWPVERDALDRKVEAARRAGLQILAEIYYDTPTGSASVAGLGDDTRQRLWHSGFTDSGNTYAHQFTATAGEIAAYFKGRISHYEIWNEPNAAPRPASGFHPAPGLTYPSPGNADWDGACGTYLYGVDYGQGAWALCPRQLAVLTTNAFMAIKGADPAATVVAGNLLFHGDDGWVAKEYWKQVEASPAVQWHRRVKGGVPWDIVGIHPYAYAPGGSPRSLESQLDAFSALLRAASDPARLGMTEYGWDASPDRAGLPDATADEATQAALLKRSFATAASHSLAFLIWFNYNDWTYYDPARGRDALISFGVRRTDGSFKPAGHAYCEMTGTTLCADGTRLPPPAAVGATMAGTSDAAIIACYGRNGGAGAVGMPFDNGGSAYVHRWGSGVVQDYDSGPLGPSLCMHADAAATAFMVRGGIRDAYLSSGGGEGRLGFPQEDEHGSATGPHQRFAGGYITWDAAAGRFRAY